MALMSADCLDQPFSEHHRSAKTAAVTAAVNPAGVHADASLETVLT